MLLPWPDHADVLGGATDGLDVAVWTDDGAGPAGRRPRPTSSSTSRRTSAGRAARARWRGCRGCRSSRASGPGVDAVWPHLPDGVALHNAAGVHDASTAELAVGLTLARLRGLDDFARNQATGTWAPSRNGAIADQRVLVVGYGRIGQAIERRLDGFEAEIVRVARTPRTLDDGRRCSARRAARPAARPSTS